MGTRASESSASRSGSRRGRSQSRATVTSFVELETTASTSAQASAEGQAQGPISLVYPLFQNPGELYTKMFFGAGHNALLVKVRNRS